MAKAKVAVTLDMQVLEQVDELVARRVYPNRSRAVESVLAAALRRSAHTRLAAECAKLDPKEEIAMAEEGMEVTAREWPPY